MKRFIRLWYVIVGLVVKTLRRSSVKKFIPARSASSRKGENGIVLVLGGSYIYHGAPVLAATAALRSGTDLAYAAVPRINVQSTRALSPDLIVIPMADQKLTRGAAKKLIGQIPKGLDSAAIGMGLAIAEKTALENLVRSLVDADCRVVLDAGALVYDILDVVSGTNAVITPHAGEFTRLFGDEPPTPAGERASLVEKLAGDHGVTILLKGPTDVISDGSTTYLNPKSIPAMTVGGTGDVLSGVVAGMLAKNRNSLEAAAAAAFLTGLAGAAVQKQIGLHMIATDLCNALPGVMSPFDVIR